VIQRLGAKIMVMQAMIGLVAANTNLHGLLNIFS